MAFTTAADFVNFVPPQQVRVLTEEEYNDEPLIDYLYRELANGRYH